MVRIHILSDGNTNNITLRKRQQQQKNSKGRERMQMAPVEYNYTRSIITFARTDAIVVLKTKNKIELH